MLHAKTSMLINQFWYFLAEMLLREYAIEGWFVIPRFLTNVSALLGETWTPEIVFSVTVTTGYSPRSPTLSDRNEILHSMWSSWGSSKFRISLKSIKWFRICGGRNLPFFIHLAIGLYKIVISQQIKEVIANRHERLHKLMIAQNSKAITCKKILKLVAPCWSYSVLHQRHFWDTAY